jgi:hypothetical protein
LSHYSKEGHEEAAAAGPDGEFVPFPEYDGLDPPKESKKVFTVWTAKAIA